MARQKLKDVDVNKIKVVLAKAGKTKYAISLETGHSKNWMTQVLQRGKMGLSDIKLLCLILGCTEADILPDPEPEPEPVPQQYPLEPMSSKDLEDIKNQLNRIERLQAEMVNVLNAIGGADEVVKKLMDAHKPADEINCENMLKKMFASTGKNECEYAAYIYNCKGKWDVSAEVCHKAIRNLNCEIVQNKKGRGRIIREVK